MTIDLPKPISDYFAADQGDPAAVAGCFTDDGSVTDEGATHSGRAAILAWKAGATRKYRYTVEPFSSLDEGDKRVVTAHVVGTFPGSPVDLRYFFELAGDKIASLKITI